MLKVKYHVLASYHPVGTSDIKSGQVVALNSSGKVVPCDNTMRPIGLAGDDRGTVTAGSFTNRKSDEGDESRSSGQMTVYKGPGSEFYVDFTDVIGVASLAVNDVLSASATAGKLTNANSATATPHSATAAQRAVAVVIDTLAGTSGKLASGIPNEFEPSGDSDVERKFALISLVI